MVRLSLHRSLLPNHFALSMRHRWRIAWRARRPAGGFVADECWGAEGEGGAGRGAQRRGCEALEGCHCRCVCVEWIVHGTTHCPRISIDVSRLKRASCARTIRPRAAVALLKFNIRRAREGTSPRYPTTVANMVSTLVPPKVWHADALIDDMR